MKQFSREAEGRPQVAVKLWKRERNVQISRQITQASEQMSTTEGHIMSSCKEKMILLCNSIIPQGNCQFVEESFDLR